MQFDALTLNAATASSAEILRWISDKAPQAIQNWQDLGGTEYARAFAVAGTAGYDVIGDLYGAMVQVIEDGGTEQDFVELVTPILREKGWLAQPGENMGSRLRLIYETNLRVARGIGQWNRVQEIAQTFPYLLGKTVGDRRVREAHTAFHDICLPVSHPFWQEFWPPMFFNCRCSVIQLTRSQFARRGLTITPDSEVAARAAAIRPQSWGYNVALVAQQVIADKVRDTNANRMPGTPPLDPATMDAEGRAAWQRIAGLAISQLITGLAKAFAQV